METVPVNALTGLAYEGRNVSTLVSGKWATFLQWQQLGYSVKKGEKAHRIVKFVQFTKKNKEGKAVEGSAPRVYCVFNSSQVEKVDKIERDCMNCEQTFTTTNKENRDYCGSCN